MTKGGALSLFLLGLLAAAANCAQGSSDDGSGLLAPSGEGDAGRESLDASALALAESGPKPASNDSGGPSTGNDSGGTGNPDAGAPEDAGEDTGVVIHDAGFDSGKGGKDAGSVVPTTCTQADQGFGCCVGNVNYYCSGSNTVVKKTCTSGKVCGWSASSTYYDCVSPPGGPDPSGTYPIACK